MPGNDEVKFDPYPSLGNKLREARNSAGMSLRQVADALQLSSANSLQRYETGERKLPLHLVAPIARLLQLHPMELIEPAVSASAPDAVGDAVKQTESIGTETDSYSLFPGRVQLGNLTRPSGMSTSPDSTSTPDEELDENSRRTGAAIGAWAKRWNRAVSKIANNREQEPGAAAIADLEVSGEGQGRIGGAIRGESSLLIQNEGRLKLALRVRELSFQFLLERELTGQVRGELEGLLNTRLALDRSVSDELGLELWYWWMCVGRGYTANGEAITYSLGNLFQHGSDGALAYAQGLNRWVQTDNRRFELLLGNEQPYASYPTPRVDQHIAEAAALLAQSFISS